MHEQLQQQMGWLNTDLSMFIFSLKVENIKGEMESRLTAAQVEALKNRSMEVRIHQTETDGKLRLCKTFEETIEHIEFEWLILAEWKYIERTTKYVLLYISLCHNLKCLMGGTYTHTLNKDTTNEDGQTTILYDQQIITDRKIIITCTYMSAILFSGIKLSK